MGAPMVDRWTAEASDTLRALWAEGHVTAEIGRRMGMSKNAVVGKAHRMQLTPRPSPLGRRPDGPRVAKPGRITAVHCSDLPLTKWRDGQVGIKDFSGQIIAIHEAAGWVLHSRRTIWKCPVTEMTRTKHVGLLYKQLHADSAKSRGGMPDYLLTFVKPGVNAAPIVHKPEDFPVSQWQEWASPVWMTVNQTRVLNVAAARSTNDERHLCPLQLDVIDRALILWSNPGDVVLSPFMGIGSEGYGALKAGRRFAGVELKPEYWRQACRNLAAEDRQADLLVGAA